MEDRLIIGYDDCSDTDDISALVVCREKGDKYEIVNALVGQEARELYERLTTQN